MSGYLPILNEQPVTNVFGEHVYKVRVTFDASGNVTVRAKDVQVAKVTTTTWTVTFPCPYGEVTEFSQSWAKPTGADPLLMSITTNALTSTGVLTLTSVSTNSAGTATAPADGDIVYLTFGVSQDLQNGNYTSTG